MAESDPKTGGSQSGGIENEPTSSQREAESGGEDLATDAEAWGFTKKKGGLATETKAGLAIIVLLLGAFAFIVYNKMGKPDGTEVASESPRDETDSGDDAMPAAPTQPAAPVDQVAEPQDAESTAMFTAQSEPQAKPQSEPQTAAADAFGDDPWAVVDESSPAAGAVEVAAAAGVDSPQVARTAANVADDFSAAGDVFGSSATSAPAPVATPSTSAADDDWAVTASDPDPWADQPQTPSAGSAAPTTTTTTTFDAHSATLDSQQADKRVDPFESRPQPPTDSHLHDHSTAAPSVANNASPAAEPSGFVPEPDMFGDAATAEPSSVDAAQRDAQPDVVSTEPGVIASRPADRQPDSRGTAQPTVQPVDATGFGDPIGFEDPPASAQVRSDAFSGSSSAAGFRRQPSANEDPWGTSADQPAARTQPVSDTCEVGENDTFWSISRRVYGTARYYRALAMFNQATVSDPRRLRPGMRLSVPEPQVLEERYPQLFPSRRSSTAAESSAAKTPGLYVDRDGRPVYRVGSQDSLSRIAQRHLGRASRWVQIYELNRDKLTGPTALRPGMTLAMPADASAVSRVR